MEGCLLLSLLFLEILLESACLHGCVVLGNDTAGPEHKSGVRCTVLGVSVLVSNCGYREAGDGANFIKAFDKLYVLHRHLSNLRISQRE